MAPPFTQRTHLPRRAELALKKDPALTRKDLGLLAAIKKVFTFGRFPRGIFRFPAEAGGVRMTAGRSEVRAMQGCNPSAAPEAGVGRVARGFSFHPPLLRLIPSPPLAENPF